MESMGPVNSYSMMRKTMMQAKVNLDSWLIQFQFFMKAKKVYSK